MAESKQYVCHVCGGEEFKITPIYESVIGGFIKRGEERVCTCCKEAKTVKF